MHTMWKIYMVMDGMVHPICSHSIQMNQKLIKKEQYGKNCQTKSTDDYYLYIPSKFEILSILEDLCDKEHIPEQLGGTSAHTFNKNIGKLFNIQTTKLYSTSSQYASGSEYAKYIYCADISNISFKSTAKNSALLSIALIHFK